MQPIKLEKEIYINYDSPNAEVAAEICKFLLNKKLSYRDMNEALFLADRVLHERALLRVNIPKDIA